MTASRLRVTLRGASVASVLCACVGLQSGLAWGQAPAADPTRTALRVCQDPNNMPFSNDAHQGIENKLAEMMGKSLGLPVSYYSFPQRMNFVRNTLRYKLPGEDFRCDIVMGVPVGFDQVSTTRPYYRSTYAIVIPQGRGWDDIRSQEDLINLPADRRSKLRIGLVDRSPISEWLSRHGLVEQGIPYRLLDADPSSYPGQLIEKELADGKVDVMMIWGPLAGYFAKRSNSPKMNVITMHSEPKLKLDYEMAMGVRYGEPEWKKQVETWLDSHRGEIRTVLEQFGVPLVELSDRSGGPSSN